MFAIREIILYIFNLQNKKKDFQTKMDFHLKKKKIVTFQCLLFHYSNRNVPFQLLVNGKKRHITKHARVCKNICIFSYIHSRKEGKSKLNSLRTMQVNINNITRKKITQTNLYRIINKQSLIQPEKLAEKLICMKTIEHAMKT